MKISIGTVLASIILGSLSSGVALGETLYKGGAWANVATDDKAQVVGDVITVVIQQASEARNSARNTSRKSTDLSGVLASDAAYSSGEFSFGGGYSGQGEVRRSESLAASISAQVVHVYENGDLQIEGEQNIYVNGERTNIKLRGRVRKVDVSPDNLIPSTRIAGAEISYDGSGFADRSAKPGLLNRLFNFLGLN